MNLFFKNVIEDIENYNTIKQIYNEAFPINERFPINYLYKKANNKDVNFNSVYDNDKLIGIIYTISKDNLLFILYFAVNNAYRGKGYGSKILEFLKQKYNDYTILLEIEQLDKNANNYNQRLKRKAFYEKNGFYDTNKLLSEGKNTFEIMTTNPNINLTKDLFIGIFRKMFTGFSSIFVPFFIRLSNK